MNLNALPQLSALSHLQVSVDELLGVNVFHSFDYLQGKFQTFFTSLGVLSFLLILLFYPGFESFFIT